MNRYALAAFTATGCVLAFAVVHASADDMVVGNAWRSSVSPATQAALDDSHEHRLTPLRSVSIAKRPSHTPWGRERARAVNQLPEERRVESTLTAKDIEASGSYSASEKFSIASFTRPLPIVANADSVEVRTVARAGGPGDRLVVARNTTYSSASPEVLRDALRVAANVVSVDVGKSAAARPVRRVAPSTATDTSVTIIGRPGAKVQEISGNGVVVDDDTPVLNTMSAQALERQAAAREALDAKNQELKEQREQQLEPEADSETVNSDTEAAAEAPPAPPGPREVETERRYDWRKGLYVRVPKDSPDIPAPSVVVAPAGRAGAAAADESGAPLRGKVPRMPKPDEKGKSDTPAAVPDDAAGK